MGKFCFIFGHRDAPDHILPNLKLAVEKLYCNHGIRHFIVGHYGNFDRLADCAVKAVKNRYADIDLRLLLPYHPAQRQIKPPEYFDGTYYPDGLEHIPLLYRIVAANRLMVRAADAVICYVRYSSNAKALLKMAIGRNIPLHNLGV